MERFIRKLSFLPVTLPPHNRGGSTAGASGSQRDSQLKRKMCSPLLRSTREITQKTNKDTPERMSIRTLGNPHLFQTSTEGSPVSESFQSLFLTATWHQWASSIKGECISQETRSIKAKYHPQPSWMSKQEAEIFTRFKHHKLNTKPSLKTKQCTNWG